MSRERPYERKTDNDRLTWFNEWWARWGKTIVWPVAVSVFFYVRAHYLEPIATIPALHKADSASLAQRSKIATQIEDDVVPRLDGHDTMFQILVKLQCKEITDDADRDLKALCANLPDVTAEQVRRIMSTKPRR